MDPTVVQGNTVGPARGLSIGFFGCEKYLIVGSLICDVIYLGFYYAGPEDNVPYNRQSLISEYLIYEDFYKEKRYEISGPVLVVPYKRVPYTRG